MTRSVSRKIVNIPGGGVTEYLAIEAEVQELHHHHEASGLGGRQQYRRGLEDSTWDIIEKGV